MAEDPMQVPMQISFHGVDHSEAVESAIREKAAKLEQFNDRITRCHVTVQRAGRHHHKGNLYRVQIALTLPGQELVVKREGKQDHAHEDVYVAIRDAFDAARRQLEKITRQRRGEVKSHETPPHGRIVRLFPRDGYGFIESADGLEIYFHRNSVVGVEFDKLEVGAEVRFVAADGEKGLQASTVKLVGKHHIAE